MSWQIERINRTVRISGVAILIACVSAGNLGWSQDAAPSPPATPLDADGKLVRFEPDIAPILRARCVKCHGPEEAKADFRVDDYEWLIDYIEPGDAASSTLYIDYLTSEDEDMLMPPPEHGGPLSSGELALLRIWIDEGASWPEGYQLLGTEQDDEEHDASVVKEIPPTLGGRLWKAIGYLHPATIHFPIALFVFGGLFVLLGIKWPAIGTQIPLACLWFGTVAAIVSVLMGWSLAPTAGYGAGWELLSFDRDVDAHRWSGVIVTIAAVLFSILAVVALWKNSRQLTGIWKAGLLALALLVGLVGHQGGEMTYGRDFYQEMFRILRGELRDRSNQTDSTGQPDATEQMEPTDSAVEAL